MATLKGNSGATATTNSGYPSVTQNASFTNFTSPIDFAGNALLPETLDKKVKRFGNRSISGLLSKMAAEYALDSSVIQWTEDNRLHIKATGASVEGSGAAQVNNIEFNGANPGFRAGETVILVDGDGNEIKARVASLGGTSSAATMEIQPYGSASAHATFSTTSDVTIIAYGSEFAKGTNGMVGSLETTYVDRENNPIILKDKFAVTGSDIAQKGWIEVSDANGDGGHGYLWYLQSEIDNRARFMDKLETAMVEAVPAADGSAAKTAGFDGSRGLFHELDSYGSTFTGGFDDSSASEGIDDFDAILKQLDTQGNIEENTLYLNREQSLKIDNILGNQSDFGGAGGGPSWGSFANSKDMALNLGFSGWRRGSYDFYKTDWKYLNDTQARRDFGSSGASAQANIQGIMCPMGSSSVYDEMLSSTVTRPYMHIRYRAVAGENRKLKMFLTGSAGGANTNDLDAMEVHYLSERCLVVQAANNFAIFKRN